MSCCTHVFSLKVCFMFFSLARKRSPTLPPPSLPTTASHTDDEEIDASEVDHLLPIGHVEGESRANSDVTFRSGLRRAAKTIGSPAMLLLLAGGSLRQSAGATWSYNAQLYFQQYYPGFNPGLAISLSTLIGGAVGCFLGGYLADMVVQRLGLYARVLVMAVTQVREEKWEA